MVVFSFAFFLIFNLYALSYEDILTILRKNPFSPERVYKSKQSKKQYNTVKSQTQERKNELKSLFNSILGIVKKEHEKYLLIHRNNEIMKLKQGDTLYRKYKILLIEKDKVILLRTDNKRKIIITLKRERNENKGSNKRK